MFRASALSITAPARFFRPFSASSLATSRSFHSGSTSRQEQQQQQRQSSDGSRTPADAHASTGSQVQESAEDLASASDPSESIAAAADVQVSPQERTTVPSHDPLSGPSASPDDGFPRRADPPPNLDAIKQHLREWSEQTAVEIRNRADDFTLRSKTTFSQLGAHLNKVTGYEEIEALKRQVVEQETKIVAARQAARDAKVAYQQSVIQRSNSQREVNELLQRKSIWTDNDVGRFTTLVRQDHLYEQEEQRAKLAVDETENAVEREFTDLMRIILARYHEEQVWSDKIRSASTYGQLTVLGLNLVVFILAIVVVEPWKRRNIAKTFENKVHQLSMENAAKLDASMQEIGKQLGEQGRLMEVLKDELKEGLDAIAEKEREKLDKGESKVPGPAAILEFTNPKKLELVAVGAGAFLATVLSWLWLGR